MKSIINIKIKDENYYSKSSKISKFKDRFKIKFINEELIKELDTKIKYIEMPANINKEAYQYNIARAYNRFNDGKSMLCPNGKRSYDYRFLNEFQKKLIAFSVVESLKIILLKSQKNIRSANILVDDGCKEENKYIIEELAKEARNIIILTKRVRKIEKLRHYIISNYGTTIQLMYKEEDIKYIDFVISSEEKDYNLKNIWYLDDLYVPKKEGLYINKVEFSVPWESNQDFFSPELLGGLLSTEKKKSIKELLINNEIILERISFNSKDILI